MISRYIPSPLSQSETAFTVASASFCAVAPRTARPCRTVASGKVFSISRWLWDWPLPSWVHRGRMVLPVKSNAV